VHGHTHRLPNYSVPRQVQLPRVRRVARDLSRDDLHRHDGAQVPQGVEHPVRGTATDFDIDFGPFLIVLIVPCRCHRLDHPLHTCTNVIALVYQIITTVMLLGRSIASTHARVHAAARIPGRRGGGLLVRAIRSPLGPGPLGQQAPHTPRNV